MNEETHAMASTMINNCLAGLQVTLDLMILSIPSGERRNKLTDVNIRYMALKQAWDDYKELG
jgi:hypothetical protein